MKRIVISVFLLLLPFATHARNAVFGDGTNFYCAAEGDGTNAVVMTNSAVAGGMSADTVTASSWMQTPAAFATTGYVEAIIVTNNYKWEDLCFPVNVAAPVTPNAHVSVNDDNNSITFDTLAGTNIVSDDHIWGVAQMSHTYLPNSDVEPHVHFEQANADQTNCWWLYYRNQSLDTNIVTAWTVTGPASNVYAYTSGTINQIATFGLITMSNMLESSNMDWKIFRDGNEGTGDIELKEFDIHYQIQKPTGGDTY